MGFKDILFGKKTAASFAPTKVITVDKEGAKTGDLGQQKLRSGFSALEAYDPTKSVQFGAAQKLKSLGAQGEDLTRSLESKIRSRGIGGSSVGLAQERAIETDIAGRKGDVSAGLPSAIEQAKLAQTQRLIGASQNMVSAGQGSRMLAKGTAAKGRGGGLAKLAVQGAGAYFGGPGGAQAAGAGYDAMNTSKG